MIKLKVPEMHCEKCVARIHQTLEQAGIEHEIDLDHKMVSIPENAVDKTCHELEEIGFSARRPGLLFRLFGK